MSQIDYNLLAGNMGGEPPNGLHTAYLAVAKLLDLPSGDRLVTEWQVPGSYYWTTWHGFAQNRIAVTQEYLDALGVDRSQITSDDAFENALAAAQGRTYQVRTEAWSGGINTFVEQTLDGGTHYQQQPPPAQLDDDLGTDTSGLPEPVPAGAFQLPDVDDIPF
jgi:hypothetical protein